MKVYETKNLRNLAFLGHSGSGKTSMVEAVLFQTAAINRRGTVDERSTVSDFNELEQERSSSVFATPVFTEFKDKKINIIDTPGYNDYIGEIVSATRAADTGVIFINSQNGVEVGAENGWTHIEKENKPAMFVINKLEVEQAKFDVIVEDLKDRYGRSVSVVQYPLHAGAGFNSIVDILTMSLYEYHNTDGKPEKKELPASEKEKAEGLRNELMELVAESDDDLMNNFFENGTLTDEEFNTGLKKSIVARQIFPVFSACSKNNVGTSLLVDFIIDFVPSPAEMLPFKDIHGTEVKAETIAPTSMFIYKIFSEPHLGDMTFFRVYSGKVEAGMDIFNEQKSSTERFNQLFIVSGKKRVEVPTLLAGDIGATVKLKNTNISDTLHDKGFDVHFPELEYPEPIVRVAVVPKTKGEEEKVGMGLKALEAEDPSYNVEHSQELRQIILHAQGELHLAAAKWRLEHRYKVESEFVEPRVPYRETIQKQVRGSYRHKKQTGGAGQFAEVHMLIEPWFEGMPNPEGIPVRNKELIELDWGGKLEFVNSIVGGVIDQRFLPAILKGVMDKMTNGPLTGCYVRDIRVVIFDGKMHPVDSNEAAFKTAGLMVFKDNFLQAQPKLLEPVYNIEIKVPEEFVGDVMSDLPTRRGVILGIETEGHYQIIKARMPLAELDKYATTLRSMTQARATYKQEFAEYQAVPPMVQQKLMEENKKRQEEE
jgi:elongation factor G